MRFMKWKSWFNTGEIKTRFMAYALTIQPHVKALKNPRQALEYGRYRMSRLWILTWPEIAVVLVALPYSVMANKRPGDFLVLTAMLVAQNATFTMVSRARQSSNLMLHGFFAVFSNGFFIFVLTAFAEDYDNVPLKLWYIVCTVIGSVHAHHVSLHRIESAKKFVKDRMVNFGEFDLFRQKIMGEVQNLDRRITVLQLSPVIDEPVSSYRPHYSRSRRRRYVGLVPLPFEAN